MKEEEMRKITDEVYMIGNRNGGIEMKNRILKKINRDWKLPTIKPSGDLVIKILEKIDKITI